MLKYVYGNREVAFLSFFTLFLCFFINFKEKQAFVTQKGFPECVPLLSTPDLFDG